MSHKADALAPYSVQLPEIVQLPNWEKSLFKNYILLVFFKNINAVVLSRILETFFIIQILLKNLKNNIDKLSFIIKRIVM